MGITIDRFGSFTPDHSLDTASDPQNKENVGERFRQGSIFTLSIRGCPEIGNQGSISFFESNAEKRSRLRSLNVAYATMFISSIGFSITITGLWPYMHTLDPTLEKSSVGLAVAANPIGQFIACPLFGLWSNKLESIRVPGIVTAVLFILGGLFYAILPLLSGMHGDACYYSLLVSRLIVGFSAGNMALMRSYIASATTIQERTVAISKVASAQALGLIVGPVFQAALSALISMGKKLDDGIPDTDQYSACGWVCVVFGAINIIIFTPIVFEEHNIAAREVAMMKTENDSTKLPRPDLLAVIGLIFSFFLASVTIVLIETLAEPLVQDQYGWSDDKAVLIVGITIGFGGVICMVTFAVSGIICKKFDERKVITAIGYPILVVGLILFIPWGNTPMARRCTGNETMAIVEPFTLVDGPEDLVTGVSLNGDIKNKDLFEEDISVTDGYYYYRHGTSNSEESEGCSEFGCPFDEQEWCAYVPQIPVPQLAIAFILIMCGYSFCFSVSQAIYSKVLGPRPQGLWMGILSGSGGLSRIIGPVYVSNVYTLCGTYVTFGSVTAVAVIAMSELIALYRRLVPIEISSIEEVNHFEGTLSKEKF